MIVFISDPHLDDYTWASKPLAGDAYDSWWQIVDFVCENKAGVIILGDLLNKKYPSSLAVMHMRNGLNKMLESCGQILAIQGQHDRANPPWFRIVDSKFDGCIVHLRPDETIKYHGYKVCGIDNMSRPQLLQALDTVPKDTDILCLHNLLKDVISEDFGDISISELPKVPLIAMGDYHNISMLEDKCGDFNRVVFHPGSTCIHKISEVPFKYYMYLTDKKQLCKMPLKTRRVVKKRVTSEKELKELCKSLSETAECDHDTLATLVYVEYPGTLKEVYRNLFDLCKKLGYYFWAAPYYAEEMKTSDREAITSESADECLESLVTKGSEEYKFISKILNDNDPRKTIQEERPKIVADYVSHSASG